ncbi:hypothetical protein [Solirubrobacter soli]|uniref:hypothetical protein n=1 Tax=Solirubrobacter soli TaxID=363832 RepID=UPI0012FBC726|nr:hypothetical protein [Solirubrobacter soli]
MAFVVACGGGAAVAGASVNPIAHAACKQARIGGQSKCIARGQYCARRYQRDYRRYGFSCSKVDRNGRYHLT